MNSAEERVFNNMSQEFSDMESANHEYIVIKIAEKSIYLLYFNKKP